ncbi:MAG: ATP-binding protein [Chloroflexia bacterium]|jgi:predicted ATPase/class 3 adenylate cyclase
MSSSPTGTVTFLFTDIEGSTVLWEQFPDQARTAMSRHDEIVEEVVASHGGSLVRPRGEGDSRFAVFPRATDALAGAAALQEALYSEPWPVHAPIRVRAALHTGEADLRDGDYYGTAVNRCARLRSAGHGGQTLLSRITFDLVCEALPPGVELRDLGEHSLKDLQRPEHVFELTVDGLPSDFPPLKTLDLLPNNLPAQRSPIVGRDKELASLRSLLQRSDVGLLTLTGPGGIGKTRLALQVAADLLERFADGVYFVPLDTVHDSHLVESIIAQTFGVREGGGRPLFDSLKDFFSNKQMLLVLDNFEQTLPAASMAAQLLSASPGLKVLITSRSRLHVRGEHEFTVPPLSLPEPGHPPDLAGLAQYESVRLFIDRAVAIKPDFEVNNDNAPAIAEICTRLDGLPLAIELAAARIKILPPKAMLARLHSRLNLLTSGEKDLPSRQQTLRGAIDWSYNLLSPDEQMLFRRLSIFAGGCSLNALEGLCPRGLKIDVLDGLESLVDKSLLQQDEQANGEPRFRMLETIREYATERLAESGEEDDVAREHAEIYTGLAEESEPLLHRPEQLDRFNLLETEHDNLRGALQWSLKSGEADIALRLCASLWYFWWVRSHLTEGRKWLEAALQLAASVGNKTPEHARALYGQAILCRTFGEVDSVLKYTEESAALAREINDQASLGSALSVRGVGFLMGKKADAARSSAEEGVAVLRRAGYTGWDLAIALLRYTMVLAGQGDVAPARVSIEESLAIFRQLGDRWGTSQDLNVMGDLARAQGDYDRATTLYTESLGLYRQLGVKRDIPASLHNLGHVALARGDNLKAEEFFKESLKLQQELGNRQGMAEALIGLAGVAAAMQQPARAARLLGSSTSVRDALGLSMWPGEQTTYEQILSATRSQLDEPAWQSACDEGHSMSMEQVIDYALEGTAGTPPAN